MHGMKDKCLVALLLLALVVVSDAGNLTISHNMLTKGENETFFVYCKDSEGSAVQWKGPMGVLGPKTKPTVVVASYGTLLVFQEVTLEESGTYTCWTDKEHKEFYLTVTERLMFMDTESTQTGEEGRPFTLRCEVQGGNVTWSVEGGDLSDTEKYLVGGDTLLIKDLHHSDAKTYICVAVQQTTGEVAEHRIKLKVLPKPEFRHPIHANQELTWACINSTVNLTCMVVANPTAKFEWMKLNDNTSQIGKIINEASDVSILQLYVEKNTFGIYKCIATNTYGRLEKYFSLEKGVKPKPPELVEKKGAGTNWFNVKVRNYSTSTEVKPQMMPCDSNE